MTLFKPLRVMQSELGDCWQAKALEVSMSRAHAPVKSCRVCRCSGAQSALLFAAAHVVSPWRVKLSEVRRDDAVGVTLQICLIALTSLTIIIRLQFLTVFNHKQVQIPTSHHLRQIKGLKRRRIAPFRFDSYRRTISM
ncbi:uncharacterized [Tachysurus ichikawai]